MGNAHLPRPHADAYASSRPPEIEGEATNRAVMMSGLTGCRLYVVHVTCEPAVEAIRRGRALGYPVMGETCIQYFFLTVKDHMAQPNFQGAKYICSPPIRMPAPPSTFAIPATSSARSNLSP